MRSMCMHSSAVLEMDYSSYCLPTLDLACRRSRRALADPMIDGTARANLRGSKIRCACSSPLPASLTPSLFLSCPVCSVSIEWELCKLLCSGDTNGPLVIEGRQPAVMEQFVRRMLGRVRTDQSMQNATVIGTSAAGSWLTLLCCLFLPPSAHLQPCTFRLRLSCSIPEQALRFIEREVGPEVAARIAPLFPHPSPSLRSLSQLSPLLARVPDSILPTQARERIACMFADNDSRDEDDARRYRELYGADPLLNHQVSRCHANTADRAAA